MDFDSPEALLARWRETRQPEALGELLKSHRDRAYSVALRVTGSPPDAEDAVQDAMLKLMSRSHGFEDMTSFRNSVYRATIQCALDLVRKRRRRDANESGERVNVEEAPSPEKQGAEDRETVAILSNAVADLPDDERVPVTLCFYEGLTVVDAATALELPRETVRARLARALEKLRAKLRLNGRDASSAMIITTLWNSNGVSAPHSLALKLDAALPGRESARIPNVRKQPVPDASNFAARPFWKKALVPAAAVALFAGGWAVYGPCIPLFEEKDTPPVVAFEPAQAPEPKPVKVVAETKPNVVNPEEEKEMKPVQAIVVAGAALLPLGAYAGDPKPDVAAILAKIEARRAEKQEAAARQTARWAKAEAAERGEGREEKEEVIILAPGAAAPGAPGGNPQGNPSVNGK